MAQHISVLGLDPAPTNFGFSAVEIHEDKVRWRLRKVGMIQQPISKLESPVGKAFYNFTQEIGLITSTFRPRIVVMERFMNRGRIGASMTEKVNFMIGIVAMQARHERRIVYLPTSAVWKNKFQKQIRLNLVYNQVRKEIRQIGAKRGLSKDKIKEFQNMAPHCTDATLMALMYACQELKLDYNRVMNVSVIIRRVVRAIIGED